jgi:hypothetical protein
MQEKPNLKIDWATHEAAKYACENWHYSKCLPVGKLVKVGAWENDKFIGCVIFGRGATPNLGRPYSLNQDECVELVRIALTKHKNYVSKIMALAIKFLKKSNPNLKLIVSFADQSQNHHGGIYQATNWIYSGKGESAKFYLIKGKLTHPRSIGAKGLTQNLQGAKQIDPFATVVDVPGKYRYLMPLSPELKNKIQHLAKPYPKRLTKANSEYPSESGGAVPTQTLQS